MAALHIARIRHLFYPDLPQDYFFDLSVRQASSGQEVDVISWNKGRSCSETYSVRGFTVHRLRGHNFSFGSSIAEYPYLPELPAKITKLNPEVIHAESHLFLPTVQAIKKAKKSRIPSVVSIHGVMVERGKGLDIIQHCYLRTIGFWIFKNTERIVCLTKSDASEIVKYGCPPQKIRLIPNAVDANCFGPRNDGGRDLIVWVGRFVREKGLEYLVEAAKTVAEEFDEAEFLLVGYGPLKSKITRLTFDSGLLTKTIKLLGPVSRREVAEILGKAAVFVFPSLSEGLPVSLLEAMASGLPVVATDIPSIREIITDGKDGLLVPTRRPEALANALMALLNDKSLRRKLGRNARRLIVERYNWDDVIRKLEEVYCESTNGCTNMRSDTWAQFAPP